MLPNRLKKQKPETPPCRLVLLHPAYHLIDPISRARQFDMLCNFEALPLPFHPSSKQDRRKERRQRQLRCRVIDNKMRELSEGYMYMYAAHLFRPSIQRVWKGEPARGGNDEAKE